MPAVETTGPVEGPRRTYQAGAAGMARGLAVIQGADDNHVVLAGANAASFGVIEEATIAVGAPISILFKDEAVVVYGAPVAAGQYLITDAQGRLIPTAGTGDNIVARAVSSGSNAGDYGTVFINPFIR